jgi:hypothetical protein
MVAATTLVPLTPNASAASNAAAPAGNSGAAAQLVPLDASGNPVQSTTDAAIGDAEAGGKLLGRSAIRYALAPADLLVSGMRALGKEFDRVPGLTASQPQLIDTNGQSIGGPNPPLPSEAAIQDASKLVPLQIDPNAGPAMKFADIVAPIVLSAGRSALSSAPSVASLPLAFTKELAKQGGSAAVGTGAGALAQAAGADDLATLIASLAGGGAVLQGVQAYGTHRIANRYSADDAAQTLTDAKDLDVEPTFSMLAGPEGKMIEANLAANPIAGGGVKARQAQVQDTLNNRISQEAGDVGYGGAPLHEARNPDITGADLTQEAQQRQVDLSHASSTAQQDVADRIAMTDAAPNRSPLIDAILEMIQGRDVDPGATGPLQARLDALEEMERRGSTFQGQKDWTGNLGRRIGTVDPLLDRDYKRIYPQAVDVLRQTATDAGVGPEFDAAQAQTRVLNKQQLPPLRQLGGKMAGVDLDTGEQQFTGTPTAGGASGIFDRAAAVKGDPALMAQLEEHLQGSAVGRALADIIRRAGTKSGDFRLEHFNPDWKRVNETARTSISNRSSGTPETLDKIGRLSDVFLRKPATSGLTDTLGIQALLAMMPGNVLTKAAGMTALLHGLNSPAMLKEMAGQGGAADLLTPFLRNAPVQTQTANRILHPGGQR